MGRDEDQKGSDTDEKVEERDGDLTQCVEHKGAVDREEGENEKRDEDLSEPQGSELSGNSLETIPETKVENLSQRAATLAKRLLEWYLTNVVISVISLTLAISFSLGLGYYALFVVEPQPQIDMSIDAFSIPNHAASKNYDALKQAGSELKEYYQTLSRGKRDTASSLNAYAHSQPRLGHLQKEVRRNLTGIKIPDDISLSDTKTDDLISKLLEIAKSDEYEETRARFQQELEDALPGIDGTFLKSVNLAPDHYGVQNALHGESEEVNEVSMEGENAAMPEVLLRRKRRPPSLESEESINLPLTARRRRETQEPEVRPGITQAWRDKKIELIYIAQGEGEANVFTKERLLAIHDVEMMIMKKQGFGRFCYKDYYKIIQNPNLAQISNCVPINSLLTYFFPSYVPMNNKLVAFYDSLGQLTSNITQMLEFAMSNESFYWYVDGQISEKNLKSRFLRSQVQFGKPLPGYSYIHDRRSEQDEASREFLLSYIEPLSKASTAQVRVLYGGNEIFDYLVNQAFWNDVRLASFTVGFILLFMFVLTSLSVWLTLWGMLSILLSFPLALFLYRVVCNVRHLGILNGAAAFVIIGIGVDDVFVFINTFRQSKQLGCLDERMVHTVKTAGKATFFTSFTTAAAFAANVASSIPAVHDFGLFMSLIVVCCWVMVLWVMPSAIHIWHRAFAACETACYSSCSTKNPKSGCCVTLPLKVPSDVSEFFVNKGSVPSDSSSVNSCAPIVAYDANEMENNIAWNPAHGIDNVANTIGDAATPVPQNGLDSDAGVSPSMVDLAVVSIEEPEGREGCGLTSCLQAALYHYVALPVVKYRKVITGCFFVILVISVALTSQLRPASRPPQLFDGDSNLQMLMDLSTNFSDADITCDRCSAFYAADSATVVENYPSPSLPPEDNNSGSKYPEQMPESSSTSSTVPSSTSPTSTPSSTTPTSTSSSTLSVSKKVTPELGTKSESPRSSGVDNGQPPTENPNPDEGIRDVSKSSTPLTDSPSSTTTTATTTTTTTQPTTRFPEVAPCADGDCKPRVRPNLENGASVFVVLGIKGIDQSQVSKSHVLTEKGPVIYDPAFEGNFTMNASFSLDALRDLCRVCKLIADNSKLVVPNSAQCVPVLDSASQSNMARFKAFLDSVSECRNLPENRMMNGKWLPAHAVAGITAQSLKWIALSYSSTTYKGQSYFEAYKEYQEWEKYIQYIRDEVLPPESPLQSIYQTSEFWPQVMMEVVAVSSAIYGLVFSMIICIATAAVFTGHIVLLLIVVLTILGVICLVVGLFFLFGWEMGAVEAVSLSILVGSSVDYSLHLVEGYLLTGADPPADKTKTPSTLRQWRTQAAISHIGVSIVSSAVTTIVAAIPLTQTAIIPFAKFGQIVAINTTISILYTLTACTAFLSLFAPAAFRNTWRQTLIALGVTVLIISAVLLCLFGMAQSGIHIPGPSGEDLFPVKGS